MFDSGLEVDAPSLAADMRRVGINPESLGAIILSHGHADHAGGADYFRRNFGVSIVAGAGDREMLAAGHNDRLCPTNADARSRLQTDQTATYAPYAANTVVEGEQDLKPLTGISGRILAVPGHTAGSVVVILPEAGAALVGDLFRGGVIGSAAELHFYMCDLDGNRRAIRALVDEQAPTVDTFFVGHFGPVSRASVTARFLSFQ